MAPSLCCRETRVFYRLLLFLLNTGLPPRPLLVMAVSPVISAGAHILYCFSFVSLLPCKLQGWSACLNHTVTMAMKPLCGSRVSAGPRVGNDDAGLINRTFRPHLTFEISPVRVEMRPFSPVNPLKLNSQVAESLKDTIQTAGSAVHPSTTRVSPVSPFKKLTYRIRSSSSFLDGARSRGRGGCS